MVSRSEWIMIVGSAGIIVAIILYPYLKRKISGYQFMGMFYKDAYNSYRGGDRGELNDECLQHPGYRFCMLTNGAPGVCGTSGRCLPDMLHDGRQYRDDIKLPTCVEPIFKEGCKRFCDCKNLTEDVDMGRCVDGCRSNFHPS